MPRQNSSSIKLVNVNAAEPSKKKKHVPRNDVEFFKTSTDPQP